MYVHAVDEISAVLLGAYLGPNQGDDVDAYADSFTRVDALAHAQGRGALIVVVPEPSYPSPNSSDRKRFAALKDSCKAAPTLFILVTQSPLLRGVITAVSWLSPQDGRFRSFSCGSFAEATLVGEKYRVSCGDALKRMHEQLRLGRRRKTA
jgi:hypothetical protein